MAISFFVSDLHGSIERYEKLFQKIEEEIPAAVFFGGDLLPSGLFMATNRSNVSIDFIDNVLKRGIVMLKEKLKNNYPRIFIILGNDDSKIHEEELISGQSKKLWEYIHGRKVIFGDFDVYGYSNIPPTPFLMKDWEKYDVSRYVDPGCVSPEEGFRSVEVRKGEIRYSTIKGDIELLVDGANVSKAIFLFHTPPYKTKLDHAALDGKTFDHIPLDVHIGSIAVQRFIKEAQPLITLHGHVHESARLSGTWKETFGNTHAFSAAHDGPELALVRFDPEFPEKATRELI